MLTIGTSSHWHIRSIPTQTTFSSVGIGSGELSSSFSLGGFMTPSTCKTRFTLGRREEQGRMANQLTSTGIIIISVFISYLPLPTSISTPPSSHITSVTSQCILTCPPLFPRPNCLPSLYPGSRSHRIIRSSNLVPEM